MSSKNTGARGERDAVAGNGDEPAYTPHQQLEENENSNASSNTPRSSSTTASNSTKATSTGIGDGGNAAQHNPAQHNPAPIFPPPNPLLHGFGAQFDNQPPQNAPPTPRQLATNRRRRINEFRDAFARIGVHLPHYLLEQVEDARYGVMVPDILHAQLAARYPQEDPMTRWQQARDTWNEMTRRLRAQLVEMGTLWGFDELEELSREE